MDIKNLKIKIILLLLFAQAAPFLAFAMPKCQISTQFPLDSAKTTFQDTTIKADSSSISLADTSARKQAASSGVDTTLYYKAKDVEFLPDSNIVILIGNADVKYQSTHLQAGKITVDWDNNLIIAEGLPDTIWVPANNGKDSVMKVEMKDLPVLSESGDVMQGEKMIYNYKTGKGRVIKGRTEFEGGYYLGQSVKRISSQVINLSGGYFTTCDKEDNPHYHFQSRRIKLIVNDKVIAKPVVLYFGHVPVAALPFAIFPTKKGRHSGIIIPTYGESRSEGRFIRGLGYYWAPNDYFDSSIKLDYFDRSGVIFRGDVNYALRYVLNGRISGSFTKKNFITGQRQQRWDLLISHRHTIDPNTSFQVSGSFVSDNSFYRDYSSNFNTRLNRQIRSNATFSKRWPEQGISLSANMSQVRDIQTGVVTRTFPQLRFSLSQRSLFGGSKNTSRYGSGRNKELRWYQSIYFSYNSSLYNRMIKGGVYDGQNNRYISHNISLSMNTPQKIFGWLSMGQSVSYQERWYDRYLKNSFDPQTNKVVSDTVSGFAALRTFSHSLHASTNIYGMFMPNIGKLKALRHVVSPSLSFSYQPNFSDERWGYVDTFYDTTGKIIRASRLLEGVPSRGRKSLSFSVRNLFQAKIKDGEKEKKVDLFTLNLSSSYNFQADSLKLSNLSTSFVSRIGRNFNISMSASHSFYKYDQNLGRTVNKLILKDWDSVKRFKFMRLNTFRLSARLSLQGRKQSAGKPKSAVEQEKKFFDPVTGEQISEQEYYDRLYQPGGDRFDVNDRFSGLDIPWRMSLSFSFSINKYNPARPVKNYYLDISGMEVQLTKNWKINYSAHYDLRTKRVVNHSFTFYRNLHCWEARLTWRPSGIGGNSYYLRINVKAPQLRDLKYEQRGGRSSVLRF